MSASMGRLAKGSRRLERRLSRGAVSLLPLLALTLLAACTQSEPPATAAVDRRGKSQRTIDPRTGTSASPRLAADGQPIPKGGGTYKVGIPYKISGQWFTPRVEPDYDRRGIASWYGDDFHGRKTANGEIYDMNRLSAAHPTLPLPSLVWVTSQASGRTLLVRVNDRGPYAHGRIIDLSRATARALGVERAGIANVRVRYAGPAPLDGDDRREQAFLRSQPWSRTAIAMAPEFHSGRRAWPNPSPPAPWQAEPTASHRYLGLPPAVPARSAGSPRYLVAGVFRSEANAQRRAAEIRRLAPARVVASAAAGGSFYTVRTEAMSEAEIIRLRDKLTAGGIADIRMASDVKVR